MEIIFLLLMRKSVRTPATRYYDQFQWIKTQVNNQLKTRHLQKLQKIINRLKAIYINRKRLWNSLVLTFNGCTTIHWQVAFMCFSTAVEGILTYDKGPGITKRLAKSFVCLTKKTKNQRDAAFSRFKHSYDIRSDILHGRIVNSTMQGQDKLKELANFSNLLRILWKVVLSSNEIIDELEKDDNSRKVWFSNIEYGYEPPKIPAQ